MRESWGTLPGGRFETVAFGPRFRYFGSQPKSSRQVPPRHPIRQHRDTLRRNPTSTSRDNVHELETFTATISNKVSLDNRNWRLSCFP